MSAPKLADFCCCEGGASKGYHEAGFDVIGFDIEHQSRYPFAFYQADVVGLLQRFSLWRFSPLMHDVVAIHVSPPCQHYSDLAARNGNADEWPDLIPVLRPLLQATGLPYVIENVEGAPLVDSVMLCGTMFPELRVIRHRLFETNWPLTAPPHKTPHPLVFTHDKRKAHYGRLDQDTAFVQVTGGGNATLANKRDAMGMPWASNHGANEAIPPAYTEWVGGQLMAYLAAGGSA